MRFSLELPTTRIDRPDEFVSVEAITEITRAAVDAGFDAVNVTDHPAPDGKWLDHGGHHALDPFVALGVAASAHPEVLLHTNIYVAAYRNPFLGAKSVQSLDVLSGGRVVLGVAAGYLKPEFFALGVPFEQRGARLDDALEVLDEVLRGGDVEREAQGYSARGVRFRPVPARGRPPVWVGGNSAAAMRRAARYDGWAPFHTGGYARASRTQAIESIDELADAIEHMHSLVAQHRGSAVEPRGASPGSDPGAPTFDICWSDATIGAADGEANSDTAGARSVDERRSHLDLLARAGVTWVAVSLPGRDRAEVIERVTSFGKELITAS